jgi:hypothetical protein
MRIRGEYGSKQRLFEIFQKVNDVKLNEDVLPRDKKEEVITDFIDFACQHLGIDTSEANVELSYDPKEAAGMRSFGKQTPATGEIMVVVANRNLADVLRTLAHELVHRKQQLEDRLYVGAGDDGSDIENEANAEAGIIMRKFGKLNPIIFE